MFWIEEKGGEAATAPITAEQGAGWFLPGPHISRFNGKGKWAGNDQNWKVTDCLLPGGYFSVLETKAWRLGKKCTPIKTHSSVQPGVSLFPQKHLATLHLHKTEVLRITKK